MKFLLRLLLTVIAVTSASSYLGAMNGEDPLGGKIKMVRYDLLQIAENKREAVYTAVQSGQPLALQLAVDQCPDFLKSDFDKHNLQWDSTPLGFAAYSFAEQILNPSSVALNDAADWGGVIKKLVALGANINATDKFGRTPLCVLLKTLNLDPKGGIKAIDSEVKKLIYYFINNGADISKKACGQWAALLLKIVRSDEKFLNKMMLNASMDPEKYTPVFELWIKKDLISLSAVSSLLRSIDQKACEKKNAKNLSKFPYYPAYLVLKKNTLEAGMGKYAKMPVYGQSEGKKPVGTLLGPLLQKQFEKQKIGSKQLSELNPVFNFEPRIEEELSEDKL